MLYSNAGAKRWEMAVLSGTQRIQVVFPNGGTDLLTERFRARIHAPELPRLSSCRLCWFLVETVLGPIWVWWALREQPSLQTS